MPTRTDPQLADWAQLYEAARRFHEQEPWKLLLADQLFAVEMPDSKDVLFCSILGSEGVQFGLSAHRGARGLLSYVSALEGALDEDETFLEQDCLTFLLGDRQFMTAADRRVQASLGLKFRGKNAWPIFWSIRPHYVPRMPDQQEARHLTTALSEAHSFVEELVAGAVPAQAKEGFEVIGRKRNGEGVWETAVMALPELPPHPVLEVDAGSLQLVIEACPRPRETWEVLVMSIGSIDADDGGDAYFARLLLCVDRKSGVILHPQVLEPDDSIQQAFLQAVKATGAFPRTIALTSSFLQSQLAPLADALDIRLREVESLDEAESARLALKSGVGLR